MGAPFSARRSCAPRPGRYAGHPGSSLQLSSSSLRRLTGHCRCWKEHVPVTTPPRPALRIFDEMLEKTPVSPGADEVLLHSRSLPPGGGLASTISKRSGLSPECRPGFPVSVLVWMMFYASSRAGCISRSRLRRQNCWVSFVEGLSCSVLRSFVERLPLAVNGRTLRGSPPSRAPS